MPIILSWLFSAISWFSSSFLVRWAAAKVLLISAITIALPWVLKDGLQWFWKVTEKYRYELMTYINNQVLSILGNHNFDFSLNITSVGGYIANQIGVPEYFSILISGFGICWTLKFIGKFL